MTVWTRAYLGLGGNLGDPKAAFRSAIAALEGDPAIGVRSVSSLYRTPPWGKTDQPDFLNAVVELDTSHSAQTLLALCHQIEHDRKRVRSERWGPRPIDLDILWFGGQTIESPGLIVPHPRMTERAFVLTPLSELAPELQIQGVKVAEWADRLPNDGISIADPSEDWWKSRAN